MSKIVPTPLLFKMVIRPRVAKPKVGSIILPEDVQAAENTVTAIGQVLKMGALCYTMNEGGIDYTKEVNRPKVGDWIVFAKYAGQKVSVKQKDGTVDKLVIITDTDVHAVIDEADVDTYIGYLPNTPG
jgi:co-chaperonin GroES (HSP10)